MSVSQDVLLDDIVDVCKGYRFAESIVETVVSLYLVDIINRKQLNDILNSIPSDLNIQVWNLINEYEKK